MTETQVTPDLDSTNNLQTSTAAVAENVSETPILPDSSDFSAAAVDDTEEVAGSGLAAAVRELSSSAQRFHERSEQREGVIDYLRSELEVLRRGERRGLLRPLLTDLCGLRNDLLRQASGLPADYDAEKAAELLRSYAESIQITLESNGVVTYVPDEGDAFDPRKHRKVKSQDSTDPAMNGRIARVQRDGYLDIEANSPITPAEVIVFTTTKGAQ